MKLWMENLADTATVTASSADAEFPVSNVQTPRLTSVYKTTGDSAAEWVQFDFGSAIEPQAFIAANVDFQGGDSGTILVGGNSPGLGSAAVAYTVFSTPPTLFLDVENATPYYGTAGAYRYWTFAFTKNAASAIRQIGRIYLGPTIAPEEIGWPDYDGVTETTRDESVISESINGQEYIEAKYQVRSWALDFSEVPESEMTDIVERFRTLGKHTPFFFKISDVSPLDEMVYVRFQNDLGRKVKSFDGSFNWDTAFLVKEFR
jgi:hypothetical protein